MDAFILGLILICLCEKKKLTAAVASVNSFTDGYEKENKLTIWGPSLHTHTYTCYFEELFFPVTQMKIQNLEG